MVGVVSAFFVVLRGGEFDLDREYDLLRRRFFLSFLFFFLLRRSSSDEDEESLSDDGEEDRLVCECVSRTTDLDACMFCGGMLMPGGIMYCRICCCCCCWNWGW